MTDAQAKPPFRYLMRVRYGECDAQRVVFNARYGEYVDVACMEFFSAALPASLNPLGGGFEIMVVKQTMVWTGSCQFDDVIEIATFVTGLGRTSFTIRYEIRVAGNRAVKVTCDTIYVHVVEGTDGKFAKADIPETARTALEAGARGLIVDHGSGRAPST